MHYLLNQQYKLILALSIVDLKSQFHDSYLGIFWALLRPLIFIVVIWIIFSLGIKGEFINSNVPFILYLLTGYSVWIFFSNGINAIMEAFTGNKNLVKNPSFNIIILPIIKITSSLILHGIFLLIVIISMFMLSYYPSIYWLQLPFYLLFLSIFMFGLGIFLASLRIFSKDISQFVGAILQVGFWMTPIFWSIDLVPQKYLWVLNFNPMVYIVNGYRNTFLNETWFWEDNSFLVSFSLFTLFFLLIGIYSFKKLKPHFGDVL